MCLACGNFADVSGYNAFASFALALSPFFGLAVLRFFRLTSIARIAQRPWFAEGTGLVLAGYNSLLLAASATVLYGSIALPWLRFPIMFITLCGFLVIWYRIGKQLKRYRPTMRLVSSYLIAAIANLPFFITLALFAWQVQEHLLWAYIPYVYKPSVVIFLYQFGIFFQLLLACLQTVVLLCLLQLNSANHATPSR